MIRIKAPHFVAGLRIRHGTVIDAPPIVHYMVGWRVDRVLRYCSRRGWDADKV